MLRRCASSIAFAEDYDPADWQPVPSAVAGHLAVRPYTVLSAAPGARLDAILSDCCFYAEPTHLAQHFDVPPYGLLGRTIETGAGGRVRIATVVGDVPGLTAEVERLITTAGF